MSSPAGPDDPDASVDKAELDRLRTELEQLKAEQQTEQQAAAAERRGWWRPVVAGVLVTLVAVLAPLSVLSTWANGQIQETDRYIETVGPLADDPDVQDAIAARIEQVVFSYLDVEAVIDELVSAIADRGLPERAAVTLRAAAGPLAAGIQGFVSDKIHEFVRSDAFADAWVQANREAHNQLVAALTGEGDTVTIENGEVTVGLATIIGTIKTQLVDAGFGIAERIPEVNATFTIVKSDDLGTMQKFLGFLDGLSTWLPVVGLLLLALAVFVARDRRRVLFAAGMAVAGSMLLLGLALNVIRPFYLDALPPDSSEAAAGAVYDQLVSFIRFALRGLLIVALAVAIGAWLSSPSGTGAATRRGIVRAIDAVRSGGAKAGLDTGTFGVSLARYRGPIRVGILVVAALIYLAIDHPTTASALTVVIVTAVLLVVLELLAHAPEQETAASPTAGDPP
jgi:hypothetical protein